MRRDSGTPRGTYLGRRQADDSAVVLDRGSRTASNLGSGLAVASKPVARDGRKVELADLKSNRLTRLRGGRIALDLAG
jgi:hypothetical protein